MKYEMRCEFFVNEILPGIRAVLAKNLMEKKKMSQKAVAEIIGTTQPAISQYCRELRGHRKRNLSEDLRVLKNNSIAIAGFPMAAVAMVNPFYFFR